MPLVRQSEAPVERPLVPPAADARERRARPWLAALLSLVQPGLGLLYLWRPAPAAGVWATATAVGALGLLLFVHGTGAAAELLAAALVVAVVVVPAVHAWRAARSSTAPRPARGTLAVVVLVAGLAMVLASAVERRWLKRNVGEAFSIPNHAMEPTIVPGDWIMTAPADGAGVGRDDIVVYRDDGEMQVKRVVGLGGDTLSMRGGVLALNGRTVAEPYAITVGVMYEDSTMAARQRPFLAPGVSPASYRPTADDWGPLVVPAGQLFVLGDNRHNSNDSRYGGFVPADRVVSRPTHVYWSIDPATRAPRWSRVGRSITR